MNELTEIQMRHLEAIQGVINRMASNSFALKAIAGTITAAVIAYAGATATPAVRLVLAGILPVAVFWIMDARYLRLERLFRKLYDAVRKGDVTEPFTMNFSPYEADIPKTLRLALTWSVAPYYTPLVLVLFSLSYVICL